MEEDGETYMKARRSLAEHPFGTLKRWSGWDHFMVRGRKTVNGELSLMMLCYNFKRVLNILGVDGFRAYLEKRTQEPKNNPQAARKGGLGVIVRRWCERRLARSHWLVKAFANKQRPQGLSADLASA